MSPESPGKRSGGERSRSVPSDGIFKGGEEGAWPSYWKRVAGYDEKQAVKVGKMAADHREPMSVAQTRREVSTARAVF